MFQLTLLATNFQGLQNGVDLVMTALAILAIVGWGIYILINLSLNAAWVGDDQTQKQRTAAIKKSLLYMALSLVFLSVLFWAIKLFGLDSSADKWRSNVSEFLNNGAEKIATGDYDFEISDDTDWNFWNGDGDDSLNFGN